MQRFYFYRASSFKFQFPSTLDISSHRLPMESASVFYNGNKISRECGPEIRFQVGRKEARHYYLTELGWLSATFDSFDWPSRDAALAGKHDMFRNSLSKQSSSFCATGKNMGRWFDSEVTCCPNCLAPHEDASHLILHCPDTGRLSLFRTELQELQSWLLQPHTHPGIASMLYSYIYDNGRTSMASVAPSDRQLQRLTNSQDVIGWDHFMKGKLSIYFQEVQREHLLSSPSMMTALDWMTQFISLILQYYPWSVDLPQHLSSLNATDFSMMSITRVYFERLIDI